MIFSRMLQVTVCLFAGCGPMLEAQPVAATSVDGAVGITAVSSRVSRDYLRVKLPDGSFQPEEYSFGKGGRLDGPFRDASIEALNFLDIARIIAAPLAAQNYRSAKDVKSEKLLIMVYWGTTNVSESFSMSDGYRGYESARNGPTRDLAKRDILAENVERDHVDFMNARMLGYDSEDLIGTYYGSTIGNTGMLAAHREDLINEIEENRYFVVLVAYDFQVYLKQKKLKALWETRFSINEPNNRFDKALPVMVQYASRYFGQDSHGLLRTKVPEGKVLIGEPKSIGEVAVPEK